MKKILLVFITLYAPLFLMGTTLNKESILASQAVQNEMTALENKYPKVFSQMVHYNMMESEKSISYLKNSKAYTDLKKIISKNNFDNLEDYFDFQVRYMGSIYVASQKKMPEGMNFDTMIQAQENSIDKMKKDGINPLIYQQLEASINEMKQTKVLMEYSIQKASEDDKKFVNDNFTWVMSTMPKEDVEEEQY